MLFKLDYDINTAKCVKYKMEFRRISVLGLYLYCKKSEIQWVPYLIPFLLPKGFQNCFCSSSIGRPQ